MNRIFLSAPQLGDAERELIGRAIAANEIALGAYVTEFERRIAREAGVEHAAAVSSGTAALHLALDTLGVGSGDVVFCSALTFIASAAPIRYLGAAPVFIDSDPESWNMSPAALERAFEWAHRKSRLPRAVVIADIYGQSANYAALGEICAAYGVPIVEDAAESLGATCGAARCGSFGRVAIFSFNGNKIITTGGGGAVLSDDAALVDRARWLSAQARERSVHYEHERLGYNYRLSNLAAAVGIAQMDRLADRVQHRRAVFARYRENLSDIEGIGFMPEATFGCATRWLSVITIEPAADRPPINNVCAALDRQGIEARPIWKPLHRQPALRDAPYFTHGDEDSVSDRIFATGLCLPSGPDVTPAIQDHVIECLCNLLVTGKARVAL